MANRRLPPPLVGGIQQASVVEEDDTEDDLDPDGDGDDDEAARLKSINFTVIPEIIWGRDGKRCFAIG